MDWPRSPCQLVMYSLMMQHWGEAVVGSPAWWSSSERRQQAPVCDATRCERFTENLLSRRRLPQKVQRSTLSGTADVPSCSGGGGEGEGEGGGGLQSSAMIQPPSAGVLGVKLLLSSCCASVVVLLAVWSCVSRWRRLVQGRGRVAGYVAPLAPMRAEIAGARARLNNNIGDVFAQSNPAGRKTLAGRRRRRKLPEQHNESRGSIAAGRST